ncbi:MAG: TetR/AcrR family transcriptional regulator [Syntrophobacterales bacterium]|nr:TetR/AcrR family transcriptional regulator [Syntrophobacterales bacterium]
MKLAKTDCGAKLQKLTASSIESMSEREQYAFILDVLLSIVETIPDHQSLEDLLEKLSIRLNKPLVRILEELLIESLKNYRALVPQRKTEGSLLYPSTRELILSAALEIFAEKGYHDTTVDDIAKRAGIAKGSVYRYFPSKEALFNELLESRIQILDNSIQQIIEENEKDVTKTIALCVENYLAFFENNRGLYQLLFREKSLAERQQYLKRAFRRLLPVRKKILEATRRGFYKPISFEFIFYGFMGFIHGIIQRWIEHGCSYSLTDEAPTVLEVLFYGTVMSENRKNLHLKEEDSNGQGSN